MLLIVDAVEIRNRMRSVDDLMYYGRWKRESLSARRQNDHRGVGGRGGSVSLNQSYSSALTLTTTAVTDDDERPGSTQRRRRTRLRRRSARSRDSIVSAPTSRPINLNDSIGSAALDVDSMLRFFSSSTMTPVAEDRIRSPPVKPDLPPPGLPPSGIAGRTTSARRTVPRRRRRPTVTDVTNDSTDTVSSSFDDVQMTSSNVNLKVATAAVVTSASVQPEISDVERSRPVRRPLRRRRRSSESPSSSAAQDLTSEAAAPVTSISTPPIDITDVTELEALWELCGEKLCDLCRRILDVGFTNIDHDVATESRSPDRSAESIHAEVEVEQPTYTIEQQSPSDDFPVSEKQQIDFSAHKRSLIPDVIPDVHQPTSQSSELREDNYNVVENIKATDFGSSETFLHDDDDDDVDDEFSKGKPKSLTVAADYEVVETAASHFSPLDGEHIVEQFQTSTCSSEDRHDQLEQDKEIVSDQLRTIDIPPNIAENHVINVVDVPEQRDDDKTSSVIGERSGPAGLDINVMLSPSIELQDILDTIYTLTGGIKGENRMTDEDGTASPPFRGSFPTETGCGDNYQQHLADVDLAEQLAAVCLDDNSLDLDSEMYDFDLSPADADFADSVHLAIAEDDDDLDIEDTEYDLDDDEVL